MATEETLERISGRLKGALVADRVMVERDDRALLEPQRDSDDWTYNLWRQLGGRRFDLGADLHATLMVLLPRVEDAVSTWPLPKEPEHWAPFVKVAVRSMSGLELYLTIRCGPTRWEQGHIDGGTFAAMTGRMRAFLERELSSELAQLMTRWEEWDVRDLSAKYQALKQADDEAEAARRAEVAARSKPAPRRKPSEQELADMRRDSATDFRRAGARRVR